MSPTREAVVADFTDAKLDLETVFQAQYERVARVIAGVIRDRGRAEELAVDVFLKWERKGKAKGAGAEGWLYRAAVRIALNELRREALRNRCERLLAGVTDRTAAGSDPDAVFTAQEEQKRVRLVLNAIPRRQAELLLLRNNDLSYQELGAALNLNPASVGTLLSRALDAFRKEFIRRYGKQKYGPK
ncbi:MAG TPA: sigma-70 family RNA polymerase sigma factor [Bryobacteraceae bacterium]|nr:sigma-70 family RNA polymerase sigma factor [Bryobacteraceae bacterium]